MSPARTGRDATPPGSAPAVVRAVAVLDALATAETTSLTLSDIARLIGVPKSSTASICAALEGGGLLVRTESGFALGRRLVELGGAYLAGGDRVRDFYAACAASELLVDETVRLWALGGVDAICLGRHEGHPAVRLTVNIGDRLPASVSAAGKVMLAQFDDDEITSFYPAGRALPRLTASSLATVADLLADITRTRSRGYGLAVEEASENVTDVAVIVPSRGTRAATMAVSVTQHASTQARSADPILIRALGAVAQALGNPMAQPGRATA